MSRSSNRRARLAAAAGTRLVPVVPFLEEELRLLPRLVPPGGTCLDIGAAHGIYTVAMAAAVGPGGRVLGFEPQPRPHRVARSLQTVLGLRDLVDLHPLALSDHDGRDTMWVPHRRGLPVSGRAFLGSAPALDNEDLVEFTGVRRIAVQMRQLDGAVRDLHLDRVDLIKIDVEGAELRTLKGGERTLREFQPMLIIEIEARHTRKYGHHASSVFAWLAERGYRAAAFRAGRLRATDGLVEGVRNYLFVSDGAGPAPV